MKTAIGYIRQHMTQDRLVVDLEEAAFMLDNRAHVQVDDGLAVLVRYEPADQFAHTLNPEAIEALIEAARVARDVLDERAAQPLIDAINKALAALGVRQ